MPIFTRAQLPELCKTLESSPPKAYLLFGERYLCRDASLKIEAELLKQHGTVQLIDGDQEDPATLVSKLRSYSLLPGRSIYKVTDTRLFHSKNVAGNLWEKAAKAHQAGKEAQAARALLSLLGTAAIAPDAPEANLAELSDAEWKQSFGFSRPNQDLTWTVDLIDQLARQPQAPAGANTTDPAELLMTALDQGLPANNFLLLLTEEADKRKKLFKYFKENQIVLDLSVEGGGSARAKKQQHEVLAALIRQKIEEERKTIAPRAVEMLLERVGFHPVGLVNELDKVILSLENRDTITAEDIDSMVGRTRQEAVFELTTALSRNNLEQVLVVSARLRENGVHPLALVATLRNFTRSMLLYRCLQEQPQYGYSPTMSAQAFQNSCLPLLKANERWKSELSGHPYALYMQWKTAAAIPLSRLKQWMRLILAAELRLKGSTIEAATILQQLFTRMLMTR